VSASEHGYSGKPLAAILGVREDDVLVLLHAPTDFSALLAPLPPGVDIRSDLRRAPNVVVAWPKQASGVQTDLNGNGVRTLGIEHALVDTKVAGYQ
jgi:hypothetical protein